ncbi:MAG: LacI family DNA-binding transcriptional regulator [Oscillospiraceae bacterium]|nr:LacI family DNA-binding transcriptional regulator [Oscillospiraceae bacterium]
MRPKQSTPTIYDIAAAAGVSPSTVSRVLGGSSYPVAPRTKARIAELAAQMGYVSKLPRTDHTSSERVHVLVPDLCNPFYTALVSGLERSLRTFNLDMVLTNTNWDIAREKSLISQLTRLNAPMIIAPCSQDLSHIESALSRRAEIVLIEAALPQKCPGIQFNSRAGGTMAAQYLLSRGLERIAYLSPPLTRHTRLEVYQGFCAAMEAASLPLDPNLVLIGTEEAVTDEAACAIGAQLCSQLLSSLSTPPQAIFCENDMIALGVLQHLRTTPLRVPEDISVIGIDNIPLGALATPQLTTIDQCTREMGSLAAELFHAQHLDPSRKPVQLLLEPQLIVRQTVQ